MGLFSMEHSQGEYRADFFIYTASVITLAVFLWLRAPVESRAWSAMLILMGMAAWTLIEYGLHRFLLHGLEPFRSWHLEHHFRPRALISTPTILSGTLIALFVFLPIMFLGDLWSACALTLGLLIGYLYYTVVHYAIHHRLATSRWAEERKHWHNLHHGSAPTSCFAVSSRFWDRVFGSMPRKLTPILRQSSSNPGDACPVCGSKQTPPLPFPNLTPSEPEPRRNTVAEAAKPALLQIRSIRTASKKERQ